jgi:hypothetical protein
MIRFIGCDAWRPTILELVKPSEKIVCRNALSLPNIIITNLAFIQAAKLEIIS